MKWLPRGRDFWSDPTGRFDLLYSPVGRFVAIDWDHGKIAYYARRDAAEAWCLGRLSV